MNNLITSYIHTLKREDIVKFAQKNHLHTTDKEIDFVYSFIKNNYQDVLKNPESFNIALYQDNFSQDNYIFIKNLIDKYKKMIC